MTNKDTNDTILDYERALCTMWMMYTTLTKGQLKRYKFEYESHKNVMSVIKKYRKFLEPIIIRKMRVGVISAQTAIAKMQSENKTIAWDGTTMEALHIGISSVSYYMKMFAIPQIEDAETYKRECEQSKIEDVHIGRLLHKIFPDLPYGFDETKDWPTTSGETINPSTVPSLEIYE